MDGECSTNEVGIQYQPHNEQVRYRLGKIGIVVIVKFFLKIKVQCCIMD